ncbi:MAG: hypothetical protein E7618_08520 [Ruminococcaceae bacterium]|nr:hypothetical protein [Oscillospiraceae bacterium]
MKSNQTIIFGDSYSTFAGYVPEGYAVYYSEKGRPETDVCRVSETWWHQVVSEAGLHLVMNNSWSGSTIGYTGYNKYDASETSSFLCRFRKLQENGFFEENTIDTVLIFGGTNDSWSNAPLGTMQYEGWEKKDLYEVLPAVCCFLKTVRDALPEAAVYCLINTEIKTEIAEGMKAACEAYGVTAVTFEQIDKNCGHPTVLGMKQIKERVLQVMQERS